MRRDLKPHVVVKKAKGREYHYVRKVTWIDGKPKEKNTRIKAQHGTPEYDQIYWEIMGGKHQAPAKTSLKALIESYMRSKYYRRLADGTKRKYRPVLEQILEKNGGKDATLIKRSDLEAIHEKYADRPRKADWYIQIFSILFTHAKRLEWMTHNPTETIELYGKQKQVEPWPEWFVAEYLARATGYARTIYFIGAGTGQRPGDCIAMEWRHFDSEYMSVVQDKTETRLSIYCPQLLQDHLNETPKAGKHIFAKNLQQKLSYDQVEKLFSAVRKQIAKERPEALKYSLHGLRKLAAMQLAEAGCSDAEIASVTGHKSLTMVQHYRSKARQKEMSKQAQMKRE